MQSEVFLILHSPLPYTRMMDDILILDIQKCLAENYWQVQEQDIVCIPSLTFKHEEVGKLTGSIHYEERQLFNILLLKNPSTRLIYVTSVPLDPFIVKYYLSLLPTHVSRDDLDKRLILLSTNDLSARYFLPLLYLCRELSEGGGEGGEEGIDVENQP
jgi:hypothetical protein